MDLLTICYQQSVQEMRQLRSQKHHKLKQEELEEQDKKELQHVKALPCNSQKLIASFVQWIIIASFLRLF